MRELHLDVSSLQEPLLLLDVSTLQRPVLHFPCLPHGAWASPELVCTTRAFASPGRVYTAGSELHLDLSVQQEPLLLLDVSTLQGLSYTWTCLYNKSLCFSWTCLHCRVWATPGLVCTTRAFSAPGRVYTTRPELHGLVWTTRAFASPGHVYTTRSEQHLHVSTLYCRCLCCSWTCLKYRTWAAPGRVYTKDVCAAPGRVYNTGSELHLDLSGQQEPLMLLDESTLLGLSCTWTCLHYTVDAWTCPHLRGLSSTSTLVYTILKKTLFSILNVNLLKQ